VKASASIGYGEEIDKRKMNDLGRILAEWRIRKREEKQPIF
jgi:hypothetical protein